MTCFREQSLQDAVHQLLVLYHIERNHEGIDNAIVEPSEEIGQDAGDIQCQERLGGMLRYYYRAAA